MSYEVTIDDSQVKDMITKLSSALGGLGPFFEGFLRDRVVPDLQSEAGSERNVITGRYMNDWATESDEESASVTTDAYYWKFLEFGTKSIEAKPVVKQTVENMGDGLVDSIANALSVVPGAER